MVNSDRQCGPLSSAHRPDPGSDAPLTGLASAWLEIGDPAQARSALDRVLARHPANLDALLLRARVMGVEGNLGRVRRRESDRCRPAGLAGTRLSWARAMGAAKASRRRESFLHMFAYQSAGAWRPSRACVGTNRTKRPCGGRCRVPARDSSFQRQFRNAQQRRSAHGGTQPRKESNRAARGHRRCRARLPLNYAGEYRERTPSL